MTTTYHRTIDNQQVEQREALDERGALLRPGHSMRTHLALMDGVPAPLADEQRLALIDRYRWISATWRAARTTATRSCAFAARSKA